MSLTPYSRLETGTRGKDVLLCLPSEGCSSLFAVMLRKVLHAYVPRTIKTGPSRISRSHWSNASNAHNHALAPGRRILRDSLAVRPVDQRTAPDPYLLASY